MSPQTPLVDTNSLENTFDKYQGDTINQPSIPNVPYQSPHPDETLNTGGSQNPLDAWEAPLYKDNGGRMTGGGKDMSFKDLSNSRYSTYDPGVNNEDAWSSGQGSLSRMANSTFNLVNKVGAYLTQSVGFIGGALGAAAGGTINLANEAFGGDGKVVNGGNAISLMTDNFMTQLGDGWKDWTQNVAPIYKSDKYTNGSIWQKLGTSSWWMDDAVDRLALTASMLAPGALEAKGVGLFGAVARGADALETTGIGAKALQALSDNPELYGKLGKSLGSDIYKAATDGLVDTSTAAGAKFKGLVQAAQKVELYSWNVIGQSALNGRESQVGIKKALQDQRSQGLNVLSDSEIEDKAADGARKAFWYTVPVTLASSLYELPQIFSTAKTAESSLKKFFNVNTLEELEGVAAKTAQPTLLKTVGKSLLTGLEHGQNESLQVAISRYLEDSIAGKTINGQVQKDNSGTFQGIFQDWTDNVNDPNGQNNIALGTIQGMLMTVLGHGKSVYTGEYKAEDTRNRNYIDTINKAMAQRRFFSTPSDLIEKDEKGAIKTTPDGKPIFNQAKLAQIGLSQVDAQQDYEQRVSSVKSGDTTTLEALNFKSLALLSQNFFDDPNGVEYLTNLLKFEAKNQKESPDRVNDSINSTEVSPDLQLSRSIDHIQNLKKAWDAIDQRHAGFTGLNVNYSDKDELAASGQYIQDAKHAQYINSAKQIFLNSKINANRAELNSLGITTDDKKIENPASPQEERVNKLLDETKELLDDQQDARDEYRKLIDKTQFKGGWEARKIDTQKVKDAIASIQKEASTPKPEVGTTLSIKTKSGDKDLQVGETYYLSSIETQSKQGLIQKEYPGFTVISKNENGDIIAKDINGITKTIPASELAKYDVGKLGDIAKNPKANFYFKNRNRIYNYKFKSGIKQGVLRYSTKQDQLLFEYIGDDGKTKQIPVYGRDFSQKIAESKGFKEPIITPTDKKLEDKEDEDKIASTSDIESKFTRRFNMLADLVNNTRTKLSSIEEAIDSKNKQLADLQGSFNNLQETAESKTPKGNPKKIAKAAIKSLKVLGDTQKQLRQEVDDLQSQKDELEAALPYFEDIYENSDQLPENTRDILPQLRKEIDNLNELIDHTDRAIKDNKSLIQRVQDAISSAYNVLKGFIDKLKKDNIFTGFDAETAIEKYLSGSIGPEETDRFIRDNEGYTGVIRSIQSDISDFEDSLDIDVPKEKLKKLEDNLKDLQEGLRDLQKQQSARSQLLQFFEEKVDEYDRLEKARKALLNDQAIQKQFFNTVKSLEGEQNTIDPNYPNPIEDKKKDLAQIAYTGTSEKYENASADSPSRREHTFLLNLSKGKFAGRNFKALLVTKNTEDSLGLKGIIDPAFPDAIRIVYVEDHKDEWNFLDKDGNEYSSDEIDLSKIVYGTMHDESLTYQGKPAYTNKSNLDEKQVLENYKKVRADIMAITPDDMEQHPDNFFLNFRPSRGIANTTPGASNNILDTGLISESDLFTPLVQIPTRGKTAFGPEGDKIDMPLGKPIFNYLNNLFFLNNRNLSDKEASNIADVLVYAIKELTSKGQISSQVSSYLKGVIYFKTPKAGENPSRNQIYFDTENNRLYIGDKGTYFDLFTVNPPDLVSALKASYTYVDNAHLLEFAKNPKNTPFEELSVKGDSLIVNKTWPSYQHYLLSKRTDGPAPLTTSLITPQSDTDLPIIQKYPILDIQALKNDVSVIPNTTSKKVDIAKVIKPDNLSAVSSEGSNVKSKEDIVYDNSTVNTVLSSKGEPIHFKTDGSSIEIVNDAENNSILARIQGAGKTLEQAKAALVATATKAVLEDRTDTIQPKEELEKKEEIVEQQKVDMRDESEDPFGDDVQAPDKAATRLNLKPFLIKGNIAKEEADVKAMLPNVDYKTLSNIANVTGGGKAWGYALPHLIAVWSEAPYGVRYHEAFEQVFNFILDNKSRKSLYNEFKQRSGSFTSFTGTTKNYSEATFGEAKEELADEFAQFRTDGTIPKALPSQQSFFQKLLKFLKELFTGKPLSVEKAFYKLSEGGYANSIISSPIDIEPQYKRTVVNTPESLVQDTIIGMTSKLFMKKWEKDASLIQQLEENEAEATQTLFDQLKTGLNDYFTGTTSLGLRAIFRDEIQKDPSKRAELLDTYNKVLDNWNNVQNQWGNYMEDLKHFLRTFDVAFSVDDQGNVQFNDDVIDIPEERSAADYNSDDRMFLSSKNSASKAVKLLFATIADSKFVFDETSNKLGNIIKKYVGNQVNIENNQMLMPNLASYARLFNYTLDNAANVNGIENIISKLRKIATNKNIKTNANLEVLLNRVGYDKVDSITGEHTSIGWEGLEPPQRKMLLKLENALSKQKPQFFIQQSPNKGENRILPTNISDRTSQLKDEWVENMKGSDYTVVSGNSLRFKKDILLGDDFKLLSNLGIPFTETDYKSLGQSSKNLFNQILPKLREDIKDFTIKNLPTNAKIQDLPFNGRLTSLASLYSENIEGNTAESQHTNANGKPTSNKILPNYVSYILSDINNAPTLEEFKRLNPQFNDIYMGDSDLLRQLYDEEGNRTSFEISTAISEGRRSMFDGTTTASLTFGERLIYEINNNLNGIYYTLLPADSSTQWGLRLRNLITRSFFDKSRDASLEEYSRKMWGTLQNEIELAKDYNNRKSIINLNTKVDGREVGKSLRFFNNILLESFVKDINKIIDKNKQLSEKDYDRFKKELIDFVNKRAEATIKTLNEFKLLNKKKNNTYQIAGVDTNFLKNLGNVDEEKLKDIFFLREANYIHQNIEMHKFLFNDPAQYKDAEKRIKSFLSGREYSNQSTHLNSINDQELNKSGDYILKPTDFGYKIHTNSIQVQTIAAVIHSNESEDVRAAMGDAYEHTDLADAQSYVEPSTYIEMQYKAGARLTSQQESLHQWLMAYQRTKMLEKDQFDNASQDYSKELRDADKKILIQSIPETSINILKPIVSGVKLENGVAKQYLYKTSTAPLYYYFVEGTPAEQILINMQKQGVGMLAMDSAHKVGMEQNKVQNLFDEQGNLNNFSSPSTIDYKYFGIQVETGGVKDYQTQGSQLTKLAIQNLMNMGTPINTTKEEWDKLGDEEKLKNPIYSLIQKHNNLLSEMIIRRSEKLFQKLGIKKDEFGYTYEDKKKVADFILSELTRRELPTNIGTGISTNAEGEFTTPLEANPNYKKIKEILWSTLEKNISRPKVSGGSKILLSALGYDKFTPKTVNGKTVYTSSKLKFYTKGDNKTNACQIAIPFLFGTKILSQIEKSQGIKFATQKEGFAHVLDYLNKTKDGHSLLEGIGFRIPTQGLNSVDFFEVAEFLPPQMGESIIFPSEIVTKAGSDFDVDKMNTYTKNFYIDKNGYPKAVKSFKNPIARIQFYTEEFMDNLEAKLEKQQKTISKTFNLQNTLSSIILGDNEKQKNKWTPIFQEMFPGMNATDIENELMTRLEDAGQSIKDLNDWDKIQNILLDKFLENKEIEGLENDYYNTIHDIASLPENFDRLITPNDATQLKTISREIDSLKQKNSQYLPTNFTRLLDSSYMTLKRHLFLIMKKGVGIAAVGNTNLAINQNSDFTMSIPRYLVKNTFEKPNFAIRFKYNNLKDGLLHLSGTKNSLEDWLSDLHSQVIDGTVDVAKDEWLANLLGDANALAPMLFMFKLGIPPNSAAYYINQPAIQDYLKLKGIHRNISKISTWVREKWPSDIEKDLQKQIMGSTLSKGAKSKMYESKPSIYTNTSMKSTIGKPYSTMTPEEKTLQLQMLNDYKGWEKLSSDLFTTVNSYNYDTTRFTSPEVVDNKSLSYQKALKTESLQGEIPETEKILASSFIGTIKKSIEDTSNALSSLLNTQKGQAKSVLNKMLLKLYTQFFSMDDKIRYQEKAEASLIDYVSQTQAEFGKFKLNGLIQAMFFGKGNIAEFVEKAQKHRLLKENKLLQNIQVVKDPRDNYPSYIRLKEQDYDSYTANLWTASLKEMEDANILITFNGAERTSKNLLQMMMLSQILQYGSSRAKGSFLHLVPTEMYSSLLSPVLSSMNNVQDWYDKDMFYRNNWQDSKLVPEADTNSIYIDGEYKTITPTYTVQELPDAKIIHQPTSKQRSPYLKITTINPQDRTDRQVSLYRRVDSSENTPITVKNYNAEFGYDENRLLYVKVNKLGGENLTEYSDTSYMDKAPIQETPNEDIISAFVAKDKVFKTIELTNLVPSDVFETEENEDEGTPLDEDLNIEAPFQLDQNFEDYKLQFKSKDC